MTTSRAQELVERKLAKLARPKLTIVEDFRTALSLELTSVTGIKLPSSRYQANPLAFFHEILGVEPWSRQIDVINAVRDHDRVAIRSGHKIGKSNVAAGLALWFYCSFPDARAILTSTTSRQVDQILWRELRMMRARSGRCVECKAIDPEGLRIPRPCEHSALIDGELGDLARTGLKSHDFREVVGFTAREAEAVAGISGRNLLYLGDEASGIPDEIFEAMEGNRAGHAKLVLFGNPTKNEGEFFEAFHTKKRFYFTLTISSEETPNVVEGRTVIPGLATREWIDEKKDEWGEKSALYSVRVKGLHATHEEGKIFSIHAIGQAEARWPETPDSGRLFIGLDPAGPTGSGDETVYAPRRGLKVLELVPHRGLNDEQHLVNLLVLIGKHKLPRETPVVVLDREGSIGSSLFGLLRNYRDQNRGAFELVAVRASDKAVRKPHVYDRIRDELTANLEAWIRDGGAIPESVKLAAEMHALNWKQAINGRLKVTAKDIVRKELGRSPDRYDAVALSVWEPLSLQSEEDVPESARGEREELYDGEQTIDPYDAEKAWR